MSLSYSRTTEPSRRRTARGQYSRLEELVDHPLVVDEVRLLDGVEERTPIAPRLRARGDLGEVREVLVVDEAPVLRRPVLIELPLDRARLRPHRQPFER